MIRIKIIDEKKVLVDENGRKLAIIGYEYGTSLSNELIKVNNQLNNSDVCCKNTSCVYNNGNKCRLSSIKKKELLSLDEYGQCNSFSDNEDDLD